MRAKATEFGRTELILFIVTPCVVSYSPQFGLYKLKGARQSMKCSKAEPTLDYYHSFRYFYFKDVSDIFGIFMYLERSLKLDRKRSGGE